MLYGIQSQLSNLSNTRNISTTTTINDHTTYIIVDWASSMEDVLPLLLHIILLSLNTKRPSNHQKHTLNH
jgi:hypothetical protein